MPRRASIKVLVVDTPGRATSLADALTAIEGVEVTCTLESPMALLARVAEHCPDVVLIATDSPSRDVLEQLAAVNENAPRPVVMFTDDVGEEAIRAAVRAGVSTYIVDGLSARRLEPIMRVAMERFSAEQQLRAELAQTKVKLADRKAIERAKGILMKQRGMSEDEAFAALRSHAMAKGMKLGEAAKQLIDIASLLG